MGKKTFFIGVIGGAILGGAVTLFNEETRQYVKAGTERVVEGVSDLAGDPGYAIERVKQGVEVVNQFVTKNTDSTLNALGQVENTVQKFLK